MPRRSLLSTEQRARLFDVPTTPAEMAKHYVLGPEDLLLMRAKRRSMNRLGFAVQLCLLRHPGQGLGLGQQPPLAMLEFVAGQLGIPTTVFADYARRDQTRREHAADLYALLGLRSFQLRDWRDCLQIGTDAAWATDRGEPIVQTMLIHLRAHGVLIPDPAVLERIGLGKLDQALPVIDAVAGVVDVEILTTAAEKYAVVRRFSPRFLAAFRFQSSIPHDPLLAAIDLLKLADESGARVLPKRLPSAFLAPKWRRLIFAGPVPDRRLYETAVLATLRDHLRGAGVWVAGSRDHRAFEDCLLPAEPAGTTSNGIAGEADPVRYVAIRAGLLHERLQFVAAWLSRPSRISAPLIVG